MTKEEKECQKKIDAFIVKVRSERNGPLTGEDKNKIVSFMAELQRKDNLRRLRNLKRKEAMIH